MTDQTDTITPKRYLSMASLLSPPETMRHDSFGSSNAHSIASASFSSVASSDEAPQTPATVMLAPKSIIPSPPISPDSVVEKEKPSKDPEDLRDPQLYAASEAGESVSSRLPLFPSAATDYDAESVIDRHIAARGSRTDESSPAPTKEEYELALNLQTNVLELFNRDPKAYWAREKAMWDVYRERNLKKLQQKQKQKRLAPKAPLRRVLATPVFKKPRQPMVVRTQRTPRQTTHTSFRDPWASFGIKEYSPPTPKASRPPAVRGDFEWRTLPDYSPPISALPDVKYALKTDWKGQPLDLSNDPDRGSLHPDEVRLASTLRLSCAAYLHSKRSIFKGRLEKLRVGKEFRKTDAQQACSIDVNKASKLWTAFDKVGWFNVEYMAKYL
jgi:hypothetical protein